MASHLPQNMVTCPYDPIHRVSENRLQMHIAKCRKNHLDSDMEICPFNAVHILKKAVFEEHLTLCPDRAMVDMLLNCYEDKKNMSQMGRTAVPPYKITQSGLGESWENELQSDHASENFSSEPHPPLEDFENEALLVQDDTISLASVSEMSEPSDVLCQESTTKVKEIHHIQASSISDSEKEDILENMMQFESCESDIVCEKDMVTADGSTDEFNDAASHAGSDLGHHYQPGVGRGIYRLSRSLAESPASRCESLQSSASDFIDKDLALKLSQFRISRGSYRGGQITSSLFSSRKYDELSIASDYEDCRSELGEDKDSSSHLLGRGRARLRGLIAESATPKKCMSSASSVLSDYEDCQSEFDGQRDSLPLQGIGRGHIRLGKPIEQILAAKNDDQASIAHEAESKPSERNNLAHQLNLLGIGRGHTMLCNNSFSDKLKNAGVGRGIIQRS